MLGTVCVDDYVSSQLTIVTHSKALIGKLLVSLQRVDFLCNFEAAHHELTYVGQLAGYHEQVVSYLGLAPEIWAASSETRLWSEVRVFHMLPKLRIIAAAGYEDFSDHHCLQC